MNDTASCSACNQQHTIEYRKANHNDYDEISKHLGGLPKTGLREHIENFYLAIVNDKIIGCLGFEIHNKDSALLRSLKVQRTFRRQGIAKELMKKVMAELRSRGIKHVYGLVLTKKPRGLLEQFDGTVTKKSALKQMQNLNVRSEMSSSAISDSCTAWHIQT